MKKKNNNILLLVYFFSIFSISIGVSTLIISLSIVNGFKYEINNKILNFIPHGEIKLSYSFLKKYNFFLKKIKKIKNITYVEPFININSLIEKNNKYKILYIRGIGIKKKLKNNFLLKYLSINELKNFFYKKNQIIIEKNLSNSLSLKKGEWIKIIFYKNFKKKNFFKLKKVYFQISKILDLNISSNKNFSIISLENAQKIFLKKNNIDGIFIYVKNIFSINKTLLDIKKKINKKFLIKSWINRYNFLYKDIKLIKFIIYFSIILVILISCFSISSTLIISLKDKNYDIAIFHTLGSSYRFTKFIFILYGIKIGIKGNIIGSILGIIITLNLDFLTKKIEFFIGYKILSKKIYFIDFIPSKIHYLDIVYIFFIVIIFSVLSSLYPSKKINYINHINILKNK